MKIAAVNVVTMGGGFIHDGSFREGGPKYRHSNQGLDNRSTQDYSEENEALHKPEIEERGS